MAESETCHFTLSKDYFETLVGACPDAIIGINRKGDITIFNEAAEKLTGWKTDEVLNRMHVTHLYHPPETARKVKKEIYRADQDGIGKAKNIEVTMVTREGQLVPIMLSAVVLMEREKEVGSVGFFHDLTRT